MNLVKSRGIVRPYSNYFVFDPVQEFLVYLRHRDTEVLREVTLGYKENEHFRTKLVASNIGKKRDMQELLFQLQFHGFAGKINNNLKYSFKIPKKRLTQNDILNKIIVDDEKTIRLAHEIKDGLDPEKRDKPAHLLYAIKRWMRNISYNLLADHSSETVLSLKEGNSVGQSRLFCALARTLGIPSEMVMGIMINEKMIPKLSDHTLHYSHQYTQITIDDYFHDFTYKCDQELYGNFWGDVAWQHAFTLFKLAKENRLNATKQLLADRTNELGYHVWVRATLPQGIIFLDPTFDYINYLRYKQLYGYPIFSEGKFSDDLAPIILSSNDYVNSDLLNDLDNLFNDSPLRYILRINEAKKRIKSLTANNDKLNRGHKTRALPEKPWWTDETRLEAYAKENRWENMSELELLASLRTYNIPVDVYESYSGREISFESLDKFWIGLNEPNKDNVEVIASTTDETSATADNIGKEHVVYENNGKLFLSYSKLLYLVADGKVTEDEMRRGLFFFGCPVQYFEDTDNDIIITSINLAQTEEEKTRFLESYDIMKRVVK